MSVVEAFWLGLVQAATEFLPVSSSGHLRLLRGVLGVDVDYDLLFDLVLHLGTLVAVVVVYRERLAALWRGLVAALRGAAGSRLADAEAVRLVVLLVIATLPTAVVGVLLSDVVDSDVFSVPVVGALLVLNAGILWSSRRYLGEEPARAVDARTGHVGAAATGIAAAGAESGGVAGATAAVQAAQAAQEERVAVTQGSGWRAWTYAGIGPAQALAIGLAQGFAVLPGISRSGTTIVVALALGAMRLRAAEFSFFLSIPAILGATVLTWLRADGDVVSASWATYVVGALAAAVCGMVALRVLLGLLERAQLHHFAWYCVAVGGLALMSGMW